jgi:hypothetical protein
VCQYVVSALCMSGGHIVTCMAFGRVNTLENSADLSMFR